MTTTQAETTTIQDDARAALTAALRAAGYTVEVIGTGGGCDALQVRGRALGTTDHYALITGGDATQPFQADALTDDDGDEVPVVEGAWVIGLFADADDSQPVRVVDHADLDPIDATRVSRRIESILYGLRHVACCGDATSAPSVCDRCDGTWGEDQTCSRCTDGDGMARPVGAPGPLGPGAVSCPTATHAPDGEPHTIVGCGSTNVVEDQREPGTWDCLTCGIFFQPGSES